MLYAAASAAGATRRGERSLSCVSSADRGGGRERRPSLLDTQGLVSTTACAPHRLCPKQRQRRRGVAIADRDDQSREPGSFVENKRGGRRCRARCECPAAIVATVESPTPARSKRNTGHPAACDALRRATPCPRCAPKREFVAAGNDQQAGGVGGFSRVCRAAFRLRRERRSAFATDDPVRRCRGQASRRASRSLSGSARRHGGAASINLITSRAGPQLDRSARNAGLIVGLGALKTGDHVAGDRVSRDDGRRCRAHQAVQVAVARHRAAGLRGA